jgi:HAD superfamily hydrolase (TIGR01490 family)
MSAPKKNIAFFDFDGTITSSDSLMHFIMWYFKWPKLIVKSFQFLPFFIYYQGLKNDNSKAKEKLFQLLWGGTDLTLFQKKCTQFGDKILPMHLKKKAVNRLQWHLKKGDDVFVVSASIVNYLKPLTSSLGVQLIATRLKTKNQKITGEFEGQNCYRVEKSNRIIEEIDLTQYENIFAYGDSKGDTEMLDLASYKFYKKYE